MNNENFLLSYTEEFSGFHDHLICHGIVKRVYMDMKQSVEYLKRLAFTTITRKSAEKVSYFKLSHSTEEEIDCIVAVENVDIEANKKALDCYVTFQDTINAVGIKDMIQYESHFELFMEDHNPPLNDLFAKLT